LLLRLPLLLRSCPRSLLLRRVRCLLLLRGSAGLLLCNPRRLLLRMLLCGTSGLLLLCSGPCASLCLSAVPRQLRPNKVSLAGVDTAVRRDGLRKHALET